MRDENMRAAGAAPNLPAAEAPAALHVHFDAGDHISDAAQRLVSAAQIDGAAFGIFNDIRLDAARDSTPNAVVAEYDRLCNERAEAYRASPDGIAAAQRANAERLRLQGIHDALMARLPSIWAGRHVAILDWLCELQEPSDRIGVIIQKDTIAAEFAKRGYTPGMDCGEEYKAGEKNSEWRHLIGQALDGIVNGPAIHSIIHKFADEWRERWAPKQAEAIAAWNRRPPASAWRSMESAPPKTNVLVHIPKARRDPVRIGRYALKTDGQRLWTYGGEFAFDVGVATTWQPLPVAPEQEQVAGDAGLQDLLAATPPESNLPLSSSGRRGEGK